MALEQLRGGEPGTASSREELSVLRGVAEELGLLGGAEAVRNFTAAFGVKQVRGVSVRDMLIFMLVGGGQEVLGTKL